MMPFVRSDGYWAISDLAGVPDLFAYMGSAFRRGRPGSPVSRLTKSSRRLVRAWSAGTLIILPIALVFFLLALPLLLVASWRSIFHHVNVVSQGGGVATVAAALLGIAFTCVIMFAMTYGAIYLTRRVVVLASNSMSGPAHSTGGGRRIRRLARTALVLAALAVPVVWSAAHVHIN